MTYFSCRDNKSSMFFGELRLIGGEMPMGKRVVVLVHGFNNAEDEALRAYEQVRERVLRAGIADEVLGFSWPGSRMSLGFLRAVHRANGAGRHLNEAVSILQDHGNVVTVQTHSLGARVALQALCQYGMCVRNLVLLAPAVDDDCLCMGKEFQHAHLGVVGKCLIGYSSMDDVLLKAYRMAEWITWWFGPAPDVRRALGLLGPRGIVHSKIVQFNGSDFVSDHGGWKDADPLYWTWARLNS